MTAEPIPVLKDDELYWGDNGRVLHGLCSGMSARFSGHDLSGQRVARVTVEERLIFSREVGHSLTCEHCRQR